MTQERQQQELAYEAKVERLINAPAEAVFDAFVSEAAQAQWFTEPADRVIALVVEPHVGGRWAVEFEHEGERFSWAGTFTEVDRPHRFSAALENVHPGDAPFPSTFTVTCEPRGDQTFLTVTEVHATERRRDEAKGGLPGLIDVIQRIAEAGGLPR